MNTISRGHSETARKGQWFGTVTAVIEPSLADRLTAATAALMEMVSRWRDIPEYHETLVDLLLRVLMASPEWQEMRYALREIEKEGQ